MKFWMYIKQVWTLIRQEKLFSSIYITGTGLSVAVVMVLSILLYIELANIYPETNRNRLLYVKNAIVTTGDTNHSSRLSYNTIETCLRNLESVEAMAVSYDPWGEEYFVQVAGQKENIEIEVNFVDNDWWKVFPFFFIDGSPFTEADHQSGILTTVITQSLARKVFGTIEATGKYISMNLREYRVAGVVKDVPTIMQATYANMWVPYTTHPDYKKTFGPYDALGNMSVYLLAPTSKDRRYVEEEVKENFRKYGTTFEDAEFKTMGQPDRHWKLLFRDYWDEDGHKLGWILTGFIFLVVLLIPAVALSGMVDSRMERRIAELGVRRAFGAPTRLILKQILHENLFFTLLGGLAGLAFSFVFLYLGRKLVFQWRADYSILPPEGTDIIYSPEMFFNMTIFLITLLICMILNVLSAIIPAWKASRREIVYSLTSK